MKIYSWNMLYRNHELDRAFEFISQSEPGNLAGCDFGMFRDLGVEFLRAARDRRPDHKRSSNCGIARLGGNFIRQRNDVDARANEPNPASIRPAAHRREQPDRAPLVRSKRHCFRRFDGNRNPAAAFARRPMRPAFDPGHDLFFSS